MTTDNWRLAFDYAQAGETPWNEYDYQVFLLVFVMTFEERKASKLNTHIIHRLQSQVVQRQ